MYSSKTRFLLPLWIQLNSNNPVLPTNHFSMTFNNPLFAEQHWFRWFWQRSQPGWRWSNWGICRWWNWGSWVGHSEWRTTDKQPNRWWGMELDSIFYSISNNAGKKQQQIIWYSDYIPAINVALKEFNTVETTMQKIKTWLWFGSWWVLMHRIHSRNSLRLKQ